MKYDTFRDYVERLHDYARTLAYIDETLDIDFSASIFGDQIDNMTQLMFLAVNPDYDIECDTPGAMEWFYDAIFSHEFLTDNELRGLYIAILES